MDNKTKVLNHLNKKQSQIIYFLISLFIILPFTFCPIIFIEKCINLYCYLGAIIIAIKKTNKLEDSLVNEIIKKTSFMYGCSELDFTKIPNYIPPKTLTEKIPFLKGFINMRPIPDYGRTQRLYNYSYQQRQNYR